MQGAGSTIDRDILLDGWLRNLLASQNRHELLSVFEAWADRSGGGGGEQGGGSAPEASAPGPSPEQETPQLAVLRAVVAAKHGLAQHRPKLPSPYAAAEVVEAAGIKLCANPSCCNLRGPSVAALSGLKTCRCKLVSYCSGTCQFEHWTSAHSAECPEWAARKQAK